MKTTLKQTLTLLIASILVIGGVILAGTSLTPLTGPDTATFYTLGDIYAKLTDNTYTNTEGNHDLSTTTAPAGTFATLKDIYEAIPVISSSTILASTTYMGIEGNISLPPENKVEADYAFGPGNSLTGSLPGAPSIVWSDSDDAGYTVWYTAVSTCAGKTTGGYTWRLPTATELLQKYLDTSGSGFTSDYYWSGTPDPLNSDKAYFVNMLDGNVRNGVKGNPFLTTFLVRCVRDQ